VFPKPFSRPKSLDSLDHLHSIGTDPVTATNIISTNKAYKDKNYFCFDDVD